MSAVHFQRPFRDETKWHYGIKIKGESLLLKRQHTQHSSTVTFNLKQLKISQNSSCVRQIRAKIFFRTLEETSKFRKLTVSSDNCKSSSNRFLKNHPKLTNV